MADFPPIAVRVFGYNNEQTFVTFEISIPLIDVGLSSAKLAFDDRYDGPESILISMAEFIKSLEKVQQMLAATVNKCRENCKARKYCSMIKSVDFINSDDYKARLTVHGTNGIGAPAPTQVNGANCGITAEKLNYIYPVKMK